MTAGSKVPPPPIHTVYPTPHRSTPPSAPHAPPGPQHPSYTMARPRRNPPSALTQQQAGPPRRSKPIWHLGPAPSTSHSIWDSDSDENCSSSDSDLDSASDEPRNKFQPVQPQVRPATGRRASETVGMKIMGVYEAGLNDDALWASRGRISGRKYPPSHPTPQIHVPLVPAAAAGGRTFV